MFGDTRVIVCGISIISNPFLSIHYTLIFTKSYIYKESFISDIFLWGVGREAVLLIFKSTHFVVYLLCSVEYEQIWRKNQNNVFPRFVSLETS